MISQLTIFFLSCLALWFGSGLILKVVSSFAQTLKISSFTMSFFVLGLLTSLPEFVIGTTAVYQGEADLMVGNLVGATLVLFLLVIPLLAIAGGGVKIPTDFSQKNLIFALIVIVAPSLVIYDRRLVMWEGFLVVALYIMLIFILAKESSFIQKMVTHVKVKVTRHTYRLPKLILGMTLIFISSQQVVNSAEYFATTLNWSSFIVGLLFLSIGTNIPEISLVIRSIVSKQKDIALADYVGSAAGNSLLIGLFTIGNFGTIVLPNHASQRIVLIATSLILFYLFAKSRHTISRKEGFALFLLYVIFVVLEIISTQQYGQV